MIKFTGRRLATFGAVIAALLTASAPAAAVRPAALDGLAASHAQPAQFRFPWEAQAKPKRRTKRPERVRGNRSRKPATSARQKPPSAKPAAAPKVAPVDPMDAALPPAAGPAGIATPRGATRREAQEWAAVAAQLPPLRPAPPLSEDGPAPAPANVQAMIPSRPETAAAPPGPEEIETTDQHIPLPPPRPEASGSAGPQLREGLAPEGRGLAPEGQGLAAEGRGLAPESPPLPPTRPGRMAGLSPEEPPPQTPPAGPTEPDIPLPVVAHDDDPDCRSLEAGGIAEFQRLPPIEGPGVCGGGPLVLLVAVKRADGASIKVKPAATLRCSMAKAVAEFVRGDVAPAVDGARSPLVRLDIAGSFQCRGRNGAAGGKMSEHGRANAIDVSGFGFSDGKTLGVFSPILPRPVAEKIRAAACDRFSTVLGPGSDGFHDQHLHLDLQPRRSKSKLCQWVDPPVADAKDGSAGDAERERETPGKTEPAGKSGAEAKSQTAP